MFYDILMKLCKDRNVKLTPLLKKLGLSESGIARWRNGSVPNGTTLALLAEYFGVTIDYLLGKTQADEGFILDEIQFALYKETEDWNSPTSILTESDKRDILEFARYIKEKRRKAGK
ncbi:MAG: helix-turn-helix domain-containing protein [Eubacteriales bacterium]